MATRLVRRTSTGLAIAGPGRLRAVVLTPAAAVSAVLVQDSSAGGGTDVLSLQAAANGASAVWLSADPDGVPFSAGVYVTLSGASAAVSVEVEV